MIKTCRWYLVMFFLVPGFLRAQEPVPDSLTRLQHNFLRHFYDSTLQISNEDILNGDEYELYYPVTGSNPMLPHKCYPNGSVTIEGKTHTPVVIQYDTYLDQLIYFDSRHRIGPMVVPVMLNKYMVDAFEIGMPDNRMKFRNLTFPDSVSNAESGFYETVYEGKTRYLIRYKSILAVTEGEYSFKIHAHRYIEKNHNLFKIRGKKSLIKALSDRKADLRKYIRQKKLHVRTAGKNDMRRLLIFYDHAEDQ